MSDPMLTTLAGRAEKDPESLISVTLIVGGQLFSGDLVGFQRFAASHQGNEWLTAMLSSVAENMEKEPHVDDDEWDAMTDDEKSDHVNRWPHDYVNLINAYQVDREGAYLPNPGVPMRFRASEVQGFFYGRIN